MGQPDHSRQQLQTICVFPLRIVDREMNSQISFAERAQDRVGNRVKQRVRIGMAVASARRCHMHTAEEQRPPFNQTVRVVADSQILYISTVNVFDFNSVVNNCSPIARSSSRVILMLRALPSTIAIGTPSRSTSELSSVSSGSLTSTCSYARRSSL